MTAKIPAAAALSNGSKLTFDDEFNSLSIWNGTTGNWQYAYSWAPDGNDTDGGWFVNPTWGPTSAANVDPYSVKNGVLSIAVIPTPSSVLSSVNNEPFLTGQVQTQDSFSQLYGYFEVNAEASALPGVDSAFWLLPENGAWPPELDVFEILGTQPTNVYMTAHYGTANTISQNWATLSNATTAFNTYAVDWESNYITWYINGKEAAQIATPASMNVPMYMLLDVAAGTAGSWAGEPAANATGQMQVNWAHAYTSDPYISGNDTVVTAASGTAITDHAGNTWTVNGSGQVAINGTADTATSGVVALAFVNGTIWQETSAGLWSGETQPNDSWSAATSVSPLPASVASAPVTPSANDTVVKAGSTAAITDASGNTWTITTGGQVAVNGVTDAATSKVAELAYVNGTIWQETTAGLWSGETKPNDSWSTATTTNPLTGVAPTPSPNDTVVKAGSTAAITDASGNLWTITSGAQVAVNGATSQGTANVVEIAYVNGTIWQENTLGLWYGESQPNNSWSAGTSVSPLPASVTSPPVTASANDTVVKAGSTAAITDASGNTWTVTTGSQVAVNGVTDAATSNVTELAYVNGTIWQETTAGLWSGETKPNDSWSTATTTNPLTGLAPAPSPNDTVVKAGSTAAIIDASGNAWTITSGAQVAVNGATSQGTANVVEMAYVNGTIWQENTLGLWYGESQPNNSWSAGTTVSPLPVASPNDTIVLAGSAAAITDASGNVWTISSGAQVAVNGATSQGTANVVEMAYVNGTIWQENTLGQWYGETQPNNSWSAGTTVAPLATVITVPATEASVSVAVISATINASSGAHSFIVSGYADTFNLSGGVETVTDSGSGGNTFKLPAAGNGSAIFNAAVLSNADVFDLTAALAGTSYTGSSSTLGSYLHTLQSGANTELLVSAASTRHATGTLLATFDNSTASLTTILAHSVT